MVRPRPKVEELPHGTWSPYNKHGYLGTKTVGLVIGMIEGATGDREEMNDTGGKNEFSKFSGLTMASRRVAGHDGRDMEPTR